MNVEALKKAANSSKVLIFIVFAAATTLALKLGMVDKVWYQETVANAYYMLMGGYSLVEAARAVYTGKVSAAEMLADPKKALAEADEEDDE